MKKGEELKWEKEEGRKNEFSLKLSAERGGIEYAKKKKKEGVKKKRESFLVFGRELIIKKKVDRNRKKVDESRINGNEEY